MPGPLLKDIRDMDNTLQLSLTFSSDERLQEIKRAFERLSPASQNSVAKSMMTKAGAIMERGLKDNLSNKILKRRTGRLANSIGFKVNRDGDDWQVDIGSGVRNGKRMIYANILEAGGRIRPRKTQYLAIPLDAAKTRSGAPRKASPRQWANTFVKRSHSGTLIIFQIQGNKIVPLYALKKQVNIPAKRYMSKTVAQMRSKVFEMMNNEVKEAIQ